MSESKNNASKNAQNKNMPLYSFHRNGTYSTSIPPKTPSQDFSKESNINASKNSQNKNIPLYSFHRNGTYSTSISSQNFPKKNNINASKSLQNENVPLPPSGIINNALNKKMAREARMKANIDKIEAGDKTKRAIMDRQKAEVKTNNNRQREEIERINRLQADMDRKRAEIEGLDRRRAEIETNNRLKANIDKIEAGDKTKRAIMDRQKAEVKTNNNRQ